MGVSNAAQILYKSVELSWENVVYIGHELNENDSGPCIDIDANLLGFKFNGNAGGPVYEIMRCAHTSIDSGFRVVIIADGENRHSAKRASYARKFNCEKNRIKAIELERKLTLCLQEGKSKLDVDEISFQLQKARKMSNYSLPEIFSCLLREAVLQHTSSDIEFIVSDKFQADPIIAKRSVDGVSNLIWSSDSDFAVHNPEALLIKDFKLSRRSNVPYDVILWTGDGVIADHVSTLLMNRFPAFKDNHNIFSIPKFPVLEDESDYLSRAIIGCAIGCDFWEKGQVGIGPAAIMRWKQSSNNTKYSAVDRRKFFLTRL